MRPALLAVPAVLLLFTACRKDAPPDVRGAVLAALSPEVSALEAHAALSALSVHAPRDLIALNLGT